MCGLSGQRTRVGQRSCAAVTEKPGGEHESIKLTSTGDLMCSVKLEENHETRTLITFLIKVLNQDVCPLKKCQMQDFLKVWRHFSKEL